MTPFAFPFLSFLPVSLSLPLQFLTCLPSLTDSEISTDDEDNLPADESLADRLAALKDMIPPSTRSYIAGAFDSTASWVRYGLSFSGKTIFVVSTSALLLGVPWALAFAEEQQMMEMEKEMKMRESGQEVRFYFSSSSPLSKRRPLNLFLSLFSYHTTS